MFQSANVFHSLLLPSYSHCFFHILLVLLCIIVYMVVCFVFFYLILYIMYCYYYVYVFLLLCVFRYCVSLRCSVYCLRINMYCNYRHRESTQLQLSNISYDVSRQPQKRTTTNINPSIIETRTRD